MPRKPEAASRFQGAPLSGKPASWNTRCLNEGDGAMPEPGAGRVGSFGWGAGGLHSPQVWQESPGSMTSLYPPPGPQDASIALLLVTGNRGGPADSLGWRAQPGCSRSLRLSSFDVPNQPLFGGKSRTPWTHTFLELPRSGDRAGRSSTDGQGRRARHGCDPGVCRARSGERRSRPVVTGLSSAGGLRGLQAPPIAGRWHRAPE